MNGVHDMGGMHGFGPVVPEANEPVFHEWWERRVFALTEAAAWARWSIDRSRYARERMPPAEYLRASYYEKWLWGTERLLVELGYISEDELRSGQARRRDAEAKALGPDDVGPFLKNRWGARMESHLVPNRFHVGDRVRTKNAHPSGHTRLPRYARGKNGVIERDHGVFAFPDKSASGEKVPSRCYQVCFSGRELWGPDGGDRDRVYIDLFDEYLEPA
jgi:nitrile hydratase